MVRFKDRITRQLFYGQADPSLPPDILKRARAKIRRVYTTKELRELRVPPSNRLEVLRGSTRGQHSIRVNDQWRICFVWTRPGSFRFRLVVPAKAGIQGRR
ncbi:MAG: type II toxin-antitoxin system RelE/ParE family toxin [Dehalococcoidia bacterium]|nr:type II toxin-antitoxin system RelE/ParE family toxin [Dehalococcoidia bacterium]